MRMCFVPCLPTLAALCASLFALDASERRFAVRSGFT